MNQSDISSLLRAHRSIRKYKSTPIAPELIDEVLADAIAGSSSSGNLNTFSVVLTRDAQRRARLFELHLQQEMVLQAPLVITFNADTQRTRHWLRLNQARDNFNNFHGFLVAAFDAIILSQTVALAFEARGLGICYMGTTLNQAPAIAEFLQLPETVLPVTSLVVGYPDEAPAPRDRLPLRAYVHDEVYQAHSDAEIAALYREREVRGWQRYMDLGPDMAKRMAEHGIESLAQFYTSELKYSPIAMGRISDQLHALLKTQGFEQGVGES
jgi:nitroreductase